VATTQKKKRAKRALLKLSSLEASGAAKKRLSSINQSVFDTYLSKDAERTALLAIHGTALYRSS